STKKELIVIDSLQPYFGEARAAGYAKIYDTRENLENIEPKNIILKNKEPEPTSKDKEEDSDSAE
ncbi:MAG: 30S ribosomal protein S24e, partial [Methanobrevibacter sp.]|nr:30S ribosomal protein S24e [Methanobrevibacter sp.]